MKAFVEQYVSVFVSLHFRNIQHQFHKRLIRFPYRNKQGQYFRFLNVYQVVVNLFLTNHLVIYCKVQRAFD